MWSSGDKRLMRRAVRLAEKGLGRTAPNPAVGAVIVKDGRVVGEGFHAKAGEPHAEVNAIRSAGDAARGATLYVTLEPCNHTGRTPPCTQAVLKAGIRDVVIGASDPNPKVAGGGADFLRSRGVQVRMGCLEDACRRLIAPFAKHYTTGRPWVRAKVACSLDGRIATHLRHAKWITNEKARRFGHVLRDRSDAILVGRGTVEADDPRLTTRLGAHAKDPVRVILDSHLNVSPGAQVCHSTSSSRTIVVGVEGGAAVERSAPLERAGVEVWLLPPDASGRVDLSCLLEQLGQKGLQSLLVEGGATVQGAFWDQTLVDEAYFFYAPVVIGGEAAVSAIGGRGAERVAEAPRLRSVSHRRLGDNWLVHGLVSDLDALWRR